MRKFGAVIAVAAGAVVMGPAALAASHAERSTVDRHHLVLVKHLPRSTMKAQEHFQRSAVRTQNASSAIDGTTAAAPASPPGGFSNCPPGQSGGAYCLGPPAPDTVFETFSTNGTASEAVSTSGKDTLLVAFVQSDGPLSGGQSSMVSGGGLTWIKAASENKALGDAEIWYAMAPSHPLSKQTITATASISGFDENLSIVSFQDASGVGATGAFLSNQGAPSGTITTTQPNSWVWASGNDWGGAVRRTVPAGQAAVIQLLDLTAHKTFWTQTTLRPTANAGTPVSINDTSPTADPFNLVLVEIL